MSLALVLACWCVLSLVLAPLVGRAMSQGAEVPSGPGSEARMVPGSGAVRAVHPPLSPAGAGQVMREAASR